MKKLLLTFQIIIYFTTINAQEVKIYKNENVPDEVCNNTEYGYKINYKIPSTGWTLQISSTLGSINTSQTVNVDGEITVANKWNATTESNEGKLIAKLIKSGTTVSDELGVTIKSIKHLKPGIVPYWPPIIPPCDAGSVSLEVTPLLEVPGTGSLNPDKVYTYAWTLPKGWSMNGQTSNGSTEIMGTNYESVSYTASATGGTIKVRGYYMVSGCSSEMQYSKSSDAITVSRDPVLSLTASKSSFLCGDTDPITFTLTSNPAIPCALYYWNNSQTATTSNTFQIAPGLSDLHVTVKVDYGKEVPKSITVEAKSFEGTLPTISGVEKICNGYPQQYIVNGLRPGYVINWDNSSNLTKVSYTDNTAVFAANGNGTGNINANVATPCGDNVPLTPKTVWVGAQTASGFGAFDVSSGYYVTQPLLTRRDYEFRPVLYNPSTNEDDYNWEIKDSYGYTYLIPPGTSATFRAYQTGNYTVSLIYNNGCDWGGKKSQTFNFVTSRSYNLVFSPSPATNETTMSIESLSNEVAFDETALWIMEVYSETQILKEKKTRLHGKNIKINTSGWKEGIYYVRATYKKEIIYGKFVVKK